MTLIPLLVLAKPIICIDPGHPSEKGVGTKGKVVTEVGFCWTIGGMLKTELEAKGYRVVMTKKSEMEMVTNKRRAEIATAAKAACMIRLHCDYEPKEKGIATFYANQQGKDGTFVGPPKAVLKQLKPMAEAFHKGLIASLDGALVDRGLRPDTMTYWGKQYGALIGSIHCKVPSILVEMCVLNHAEDEAFAQSAEGKKKLVHALAAGVDAAVAVKPVRSVGKK